MSENIEKKKIGFFKKWYTYQKERFPIIVFLFYTLCIVLGTFFVTNVKSETTYLVTDKYSFITIAAMWGVAFLQFLMVRIIDEFKDYEEDCKYRSYRPVPRGLISLGELRVLFIICFVLQITITVLAKGSLIALALLWIIFFLMTKGFFIKKFLDKHLIFELIVDELMMPVMVLYLASFAINDGNIFSIFYNINGFIEFLFISYVCSCIAEVARKVRSKDKEENGVRTYTAVLGIPKATLLLYFLEVCIMVLQYMILGKYILIPIVLANVFGLLSLFLFNIHQTHNMSKYVELYANFYVVFAYLSMFMIYDGVIFI